MMGVEEAAYISKEQFRRECHIGKATALRLIQSGLVPAIDTKRKTDRYLIARRDVDKYLRERELDPEKYGYGKNGKVEPGIKLKPYTLAHAKLLRKMLQQEWKTLPDMLRIGDVVQLLGYREQIIREWVKEYDVGNVIIGHTMYFPKQRLIDFVASAEFYATLPKSAECLALLGLAGSITM